MNKIFEYIYVYTSLALLAGCIGLLTYWWYEPTNYFTEIRKDVSVNKQVFEPGDTLIVGRYMCVNRFIKSGRTIRHLTNSVVHIMPTVPIIPKELGCKEVKFTAELPHGLASGYYLYKVTLEVDVNPLRHIKVELPEVKIYIRNPKE